LVALLESSLSPLGTLCPDFALPGVDGRTWTRDGFREPCLLVVVMCNHCPYVQAVDDRIDALARDYAGRCAVMGINPNDAKAYPEDSFAAMKDRAARKGFAFPYLRDEDQAVSRAFGAVCTPDYFLYDGDRRLVYRGRLDDNWKDAGAVTKRELRQAIDAALAGRPVPAPQRPSLGCSIKWRSS
jgi:peroxiredoxin